LDFAPLMFQSAAWNKTFGKVLLSLAKKGELLAFFSAKN